jgi:predicted DNA-binding protein (UPF0251 family)
MSAAALRVPQIQAARAAMPQTTWHRQRAVDPTRKKGTVQVPISSLAFYRRYTELLLRRYMQMSLRMGRVPSALGNCVFRGRVSSREVRSFEDAVIFVYDVERCLKTLTAEQMELVARVALQEYTQEEAAERTGQSVRSVVRKYGDALDSLTAIFLEKELLEVGPLYSGQ